MRFIAYFVSLVLLASGAYPLFNLGFDLNKIVNDLKQQQQQSGTINDSLDLLSNYLSQITQDNPFLTSLLKDPQINEFLTKLTTNSSTINQNDLFDLINVLAKHLNITDFNVQNSTSIIDKLTTIISNELEKILVKTNFLNRVELYLNNPRLLQILDKLQYSNLTLQQTVELFQPLVLNYIPDEQIRQHLFIYLPDLISQLLKSNTINDYLNILSHQLKIHSPLILNLIETNFINNSNVSLILNLESVQVLNEKLNLGIDLDLNDWINVLQDLSEFELPKFTNFGPNNETIIELLNFLNIQDKFLQEHLVTFLPDLINEIQNANTTEDYLRSLFWLSVQHWDLILNYLNGTNDQTRLFVRLVELESVKSLAGQIFMFGYDFVTVADLVDIYFEFYQLPSLNETERQELDINLYETFTKISQIDSFNDLLMILDPIFSHQLQNTFNATDLKSFMNFVLNDLINSLNNETENTIHNSLRELLRNYIQDDQLIDHIIINLPQILNKLLTVNNTDDLFDIAFWLIEAHLPENNQTESVFENLFKLESVQMFLMKLVSNPAETKLSDIINIFIELNNLEPLTEDQKKLLDINLINFVNTLYNVNSLDQLLNTTNFNIYQLANEIIKVIFDVDLNLSENLPELITDLSQAKTRDDYVALVLNLMQKNGDLIFNYLNNTNNYTRVILKVLELDSVKTIYTKLILKNFVGYDTVTIGDYFSIYIEFYNMTPLSDIQAEKLAYNISDLFIKIQQIKTLNDVYELVEPIISYNTEYFFNQTDPKLFIDSLASEIMQWYIYGKIERPNARSYDLVGEFTAEILRQNSNLPEPWRFILIEYLPELIEKLAQTDLDPNQALCELTNYTLALYLDKFTECLDNEFNLNEFFNSNLVKTLIVTIITQDNPMQNVINLLFNYLDLNQLNQTEMNELVNQINDLQNLNQLYPIVDSLMNNYFITNNITDLNEFLEQSFNELLNYYLTGQVNDTNLPTTNLTIQIMTKFLRPLIDSQDESIRTHLNVYLPEFIKNLKSINSSEYNSLFNSVLSSHMALLNDKNSTNPLVTKVFELKSFQSLILTTLTGGSNNIKLFEIVNIFLEFNNDAPMTSIQKSKLDINLQTMFQNLKKATNVQQAYTIFEPLIKFVLDYYFNTSDLNSLMQIIYQDFNNYYIYENVTKLSKQSQILLDFVLMTIEPLKNKTSESIQNHLLVYLPQYLKKILRSESIEERNLIIQSLIEAHWDLVEKNVTRCLALGVPYLPELLSLSSTQSLIFKTLSLGVNNIMLSDFVNIYIEFTNGSSLTDLELKHLDTYLIDLIQSLYNVKSLNEVYDILEPIVRLHLNSNDFTQFLDSTLSGFIQIYLYGEIKNSSLPLGNIVFDLLNEVTLLDLSWLNLTDSQLRFLIFEMPELLLSLTQVQSFNEAANLITPIVLSQKDLLSQYDVTGIVVDQINVLLNEMMKSLFKTSIEPIFNETEVNEILSGFFIDYLMGESNWTDLAKELGMYGFNQSVEPLKIIIKNYSPRIYEFAKDQTDSRVVMAYAVHAGENYLHESLREWGIPYDSVYLGVTTTQVPPVFTTTTPRKKVDPNILDILINLNKDRFDVNKYLGDPNVNNNLKPFDFNNGNTNNNNNNNGVIFEYD
ncbi:unnamed protein product [Brachionus calyciflorus]|uniref:Uncharacterized protein n=1 Tax=Brachionus calyciflorus TaxID=104777 RepID=A0A814BDA4_9BILA|nr:unnamed protein product [Brachionus calyciflorus]